MDHAFTLSRGNDFFVRDYRFEVFRIESPTDIVIKRHDAKLFRLVGRMKVEIAPEVFAFSPMPSERGVVRLVVVADDSIPISWGRSDRIEGQPARRIDQRRSARGLLSRLSNIWPGRSK